MANDSYSKMPSGLMARAGAAPKAEAAASPNNYSYNENGNGGTPNWVSAVAIFALLLSLLSLYLALSAQHGIGPDERAQLKAISADLRAIEGKQITLSSPLRTTVVIEKTFPIADILPGNFSIPISLDVPINSTLTAQSNTGQIVPLHIDDTFRIRAEVPMDVSKSLSGVQVSINKEIPIDTRFSVDLQVSAVYGKELNDLINRLDSLSGESSAPVGNSS